jgi:hypothetical protein
LQSISKYSRGLSRLLREPGFADLLRRASSASEVIRFVQQAEQRLMKA